jgi:hypothetical protein
MLCDHKQLTACRQIGLCTTSGSLIMAAKGEVVPYLVELGGRTNELGGFLKRILIPSCREL